MLIKEWAPQRLSPLDAPDHEGMYFMATTKDSASAHPSTHYVEQIAAKAELELERLRTARPHLASRIDKAESIVCRQLGSLNGYRPIRIAVHTDGGHSYLVLSDGKLGRSYTVNPQDWTATARTTAGERPAASTA